MPFPSPPWRLRGDLWLSLFAVRPGPGAPYRLPGLYGVAAVDYQEGGALSYRELLVARLVREGVAPKVTITDIWVSSEPSCAGGRALWAIPKQLGTFRLEQHRTGPLRRARCTVAADGTSVATATFSSGPATPARLPVRVTTSQQREHGRRVEMRAGGSARIALCAGSWRFAEDGPLGYLSGGTPLGSVRLTDFRITCR